MCESWHNSSGIKTIDSSVSIIYRTIIIIIPWCFFSSITSHEVQQKTNDWYSLTENTMERLVNHKDRNVYWGNKSNKKLASFFHWLTWNWTYFCGPIEKNAGLKFHICLTFQTQKLCSVLDHCYANNADGVTAARSLWLARCFRLVTNQEFKWEEIVHSEVTQWNVFPLTLQKSWCCNLCVVVNLHSLSHTRHEVKPFDSKEFKMNKTIHSSVRRWSTPHLLCGAVYNLSEASKTFEGVTRLIWWHHFGIFVHLVSCNWSRSAHVKVH